MTCVWLAHVAAAGWDWVRRGEKQEKIFPIPLYMGMMMAYY